MGDRTLESVEDEELGDMPLSLGTVKVNEKDSTVTASVFGTAKRKAVYRKGIGCTLINDVDEKDLRSPQYSFQANSSSPDSIAWPIGDKSADSVDGIAQNIRTTVEVLFTDQEHIDKKTRAILVVYKGQIVAEKYANGFTANSRMHGWSMAKSFTSALIGILVSQGKLDPAAPAPVPEWSKPEDPRHAITLEHLLQQSSGLDFEEDYSKSSNATIMLFDKGDMAAYTAKRPLKHKPGTEFYYTSGNSNLLSRIIRQTVGEQDYPGFATQALFSKIGMHSAVFEPDASGTIVGSSYIYATARDYARFGLLYLNDGLFNGERILPEGWVKKSITPAQAADRKQYGYQFWLNGLAENDPSRRHYPDVPADMFFADGYGGQDIFIIPSEDIVIVRLGLKNIDDNRMIKTILDAKRK